MYTWKNAIVLCSCAIKIIRLKMSSIRTPKSHPSRKWLRIPLFSTHSIRKWKRYQSGPIHRKPACSGIRAPYSASFYILLISHFQNCAKFLSPFQTLPSMSILRVAVVEIPQQTKNIYTRKKEERKLLSCKLKWKFRIAISQMERKTRINLTNAYR